MSELEEPPAKVLKIDNIDGVTHVTELSGFPEPFDGVVEGAIIAEESGIIEGGAEPEQEEWLSEGILTDDDYNPASQETIEDRTDSQLGTGDEEHLDSTLDSEANTAESEANLAESEANVAESEPNLAENEANFAESGANLAESEANVANSDAHLAQREENLNDNVASGQNNEANLGHSESNLEEGGQILPAKANVAMSDANVAESEDNLMEIETNTSLENGTHTAESEADFTMGEARVSQSDTNVTSSEANVSQSVEHLMEMSNVDSNIAESQTYTQEYPLTVEGVEPKVIESNESDIVIQRVITINKNPNVMEIQAKTVDLNIEETMKHLDGEKEDVTQEDFERFLTKNTVAKTEPKLKKTEAKEEENENDENEEDEDENDTDDLLRMLGEDASKGKKKLTKTVKDLRNVTEDGNSSDDDDFVYEGSCAGIKNLKTAKNALANKQPTKAEPEDMEDGDDETEVSADEGKTVGRMFGYNSKSVQVRRPPKAASPHKVVKRQPTILNVVSRPKDVKPSRQYQNKRLVQSRAQSILKPTTPPPKPLSTAKAPTFTTREVKTPFKPTEFKKAVPVKLTIASKAIDKKMKEQRFEPSKKTEAAKTFEPRKMKVEPEKMKIQPGKMKFEPGKMKVGSGKITLEPGKMKFEPEEIINEEEFLDDEEYGLDEDEFAESDVDMSHHRQRIMRPEMMDEEVPSDGESVTEDGSLYDELPSSDSEDMDDWFTLDIRSEKAGDYIPLLGPRAKELLLEEKRRVSARLSTLRQSHTALIASGKQQAATLRRATLALAELDDMLRAA